MNRSEAGCLYCSKAQSTFNHPHPPETIIGEITMAERPPVEAPKTISRDQLADLLNEDLSREYQAIISYVVYSQVLKGAL
jgi:hypothetical protein